MVALITFSWGALADSPSPGKINESCEQMICESGLICVEREDRAKRCSSCDQSKYDSLNRAVNESCKGEEPGWKKDSFPEYQAALASDGRTPADVWDTMIAKPKQCGEARRTREGTCWGGGDDTHKKKIAEASEGVTNLSAAKKEMIDYKRVFYASTRDYESYLSTFRSKCEKDVDFNNLNQRMDAINYEQGKGNKVDCSDLEKLGDGAERCLNAAKDLLRFGFSDSTSKFPVDYTKSYDNAEKGTGRARDLLKTVKDKSLCS